MKTALSFTLVFFFLAISGIAAAAQSVGGSHGSFGSFGSHGSHGSFGGLFSGSSGGHLGGGSHGRMGSSFGRSAGGPMSGIGPGRGGGGIGGMWHAAPAPGRQQAGPGIPLSSMLQHGRASQGAAGSPAVGSANIAGAPAIAAPGRSPNTTLMGRGSTMPQVALAAPNQQSVQAVPSHCKAGLPAGSPNACPVRTPPPPSVIVNGFGFYSYGMFPYDMWPLYPMGPYPGYYDSGQDCERLKADPKAYQECLARQGGGTY